MKGVHNNDDDDDDDDKGTCFNMDPLLGFFIIDSMNRQGCKRNTLFRLLIIFPFFFSVPEATAIAVQAGTNGCNQHNSLVALIFCSSVLVLSFCCILMDVHLNGALRAW
ncbi:uncharacterized protein LOC132053386 [Lycium ferocissimum]|uniref:uncharacterized protein LOC132053386 n=1 Tax=Lycium ferocissimum TaxID=112874 RepID=UPI0028155D32|nr:uncharacterized protein LOC132053386 [Lycium ferocissimum]